jgi:hypothetical protein
MRNEANIEFRTDEGGSKFLRNVGSTRATRRNVPQDAILQACASLHLK